MNPRDFRSHSFSFSNYPLLDKPNIEATYPLTQQCLISPTSQNPEHTVSRTSVSSPLAHFFQTQPVKISELKLPSLTPLPRTEAAQTVLPSLGEVLNTVMAPPQYHPVITPYPRYHRSIYSLPQNSNIKRPRRKFHEVRRIYSCNYYGCTKAYGALNHLNSHILTQGHGRRRRACEFHHLTRQ